jgi:catechol 2,3-dioxygenase-like lactoylglutathione lyase family enzyme
LGSTISKVDSVGIPSSNTERSLAFYVETLGLRSDERSSNEFWVGETCFGIWEPARMGIEFQPQPNGIVLLQVEDVAAARADLERKGV